MLTRERVLNDFKNSCLGHFLNFDAKTKLSSLMVHNILAKEIIVEGAGDFEIWFGINQHQVRFFKVEFCLITGLNSRNYPTL